MAEFDEKLNALLSNPESMAQIMQLAQSLSNNNEAGTSSPPPAQGPQQPPPQQPQPAQSVFSSFSPQQTAASGPDFLSSLTSGLDPKVLMRLLPLVQELGNQQNSNARQLLYALRPYLKPERQEKIERALQLARLFHLGKKFLARWEG